MADGMGYFEFADRVRLTDRFLFDRECRAFLERLAEDAVGRSRTFSPEDVFWRAQINRLDDDEEVSPDADPMPVPLSVERMLPLADLVGDGRLNPRGIAYLYLASLEDTAIAEVRPHKTANVTVAEVRTSRLVRVIDCRRSESASGVWADLDFALSWPADSREPWRSYLPTQAIAEFFRTRGYDGLAYRSSLSPKGHNLVLFDPALARIGTRRMYTIDAIKYTYRPHDIFPEVG